MADPSEWGGTFTPPANLTAMSTVEAKPIRWISPGRLALGFMTMLDGDPGLGKSTLLADWTAHVSTGTPLMDGSKRPPAGVVLLAGEDHVAHTLRPRLEAAGADLSRTFFLAGASDMGAYPGGSGLRPVQLPADIATVEMALTEAEARLLIIDPVDMFLGDDVDTYRSGSVRRALQPLQDLAERAGVAVVLVRHLTKSGQGPAMYRGQGSISIAGMSRIGLLLGRDPDDDTRLVLACYKNNIFDRQKLTSIAMRVVSSPRNPDVGCIRYEGDTGWQADDLTSSYNASEREDRETCKQWLSQVLGSSPTEHRPLALAALKAGFSAPVLTAALASLGCVRVQMGMGKDSTVGWQLPFSREQDDLWRDVPADVHVCRICQTPCATDQKECPSCQRQRYSQSSL